jgi:transglutaminase-like putative cysteine protease
MKYTISHKTAYEYFESVGVCHNIARLLPRDTATQICISSSVKIFPEPDVLNQYEDFFGNKVIYFSIDKDHDELEVHVTSVIEKIPVSHPLHQSVPMVVYDDLGRDLNLSNPDAGDIRQYIFQTPMTGWNKAINDYALVSFRPGRPLYEAAKELMTRIYTDFEFKSGATSIATPLAVVMKERKGVCQDFAHMAIACIRSVGVPVRYVSGYIETISPKGKEKLVGADASHAWFSVYIPQMGWVDFDPTNNQIPGDQHITIGWGRDYADIAPLKGIILSSGSHELKVAVDVKREG